MNALNLFIAVLVLLLLIHLLGGYAIPTYRASDLYYPGLGTLIVVALIVVVLSRI